MKSKTAIGLGDGSFELSTTEISHPKVDEVLEQIKAAGLCHTDHDSLSWG